MASEPNLGLLRYFEDPAARDCRGITLPMTKFVRLLAWDWVALTEFVSVREMEDRYLSPTTLAAGIRVTSQTDGD